MSSVDLSQIQATELLALEKQAVDRTIHRFPLAGESITLQLESTDQREQFLLDLSRARIAVSKVKMQARARQVYVLARIDLGGAPHRNPDGEEVDCPHLHLYRAGYGDKWAVPLPVDKFPQPSDIWDTYERFLRFCNVTRPPSVERGLFT